MRLNTINNETGQAILPVMMMVLLFFLLSASVVLSVVESRRAYLVEKTMIQARYIAESGVARAMALVMENAGGPFDPLNLSSGSEVSLIIGEECSGGIISKVTLRKEEIGPSIANITISSEGLYEGSKKTIVVKAQIREPLDFSAGIWANQKETEPGSWEPTGDQPAPALPKSFFEKNSNKVYGGDLSIGGGFQIEGLCFVTGDLYLSGSYQGVGAMVAGGGVYVNGDLLKSSGAKDSCLLVVSLGSGGITVQAGAEVEGFLYASPGASGSGVIVLRDGAKINGGLICEKLSAYPDSGTEVRYDVGLTAGPPGWFTSEILIDSWGELYSVF